MTDDVDYGARVPWVYFKITNAVAAAMTLPRGRPRGALKCASRMTWQQSREAGLGRQGQAGMAARRQGCSLQLGGGVDRGQAGGQSIAWSDDGASQFVNVPEQRAPHIYILLNFNKTLS